MNKISKEVCNYEQGLKNGLNLLNKAPKGIELRILTEAGCDTMTYLVNTAIFFNDIFKYFTLVFPKFST